MKLKILVLGGIILGSIILVYGIHNSKPTVSTELLYGGEHGTVKSPPRVPTVQGSVYELQISQSVSKGTVEAKRNHKSAVSRSINYSTYQSTAYTWTGNRTASGTWPKAGRTIAINPAKFHLGQRIFIDGIGWRTAEDIIPPESIKKGADIDVYYNTKRECVEHGRKYLRVYQ